VFYEAEMFGPWEPFFLLNPIAPLVEGLNDVVVLQREPDLGWIAYSAAVSALLFGFSFRFFKRLEPAFAESI
jgi:ABC-type polysaccharide/polyol phosphate export permease